MDTAHGHYQHVLRRPLCAAASPVARVPGGLARHRQPAERPENRRFPFPLPLRAGEHGHVASPLGLHADRVQHALRQQATSTCFGRVHFVSRYLLRVVHQLHRLAVGIPFRRQGQRLTDGAVSARLEQKLDRADDQAGPHPAKFQVRSRGAPAALRRRLRRVNASSPTRSSAVRCQGHQGEDQRCFARLRLIKRRFRCQGHHGDDQREVAQRRLTRFHMHFTGLARAVCGIDSTYAGSRIG
mmetsp:Transcript_10596/g.28046  ORF Transcript_10596/g.28046 Transcript_10596/m.28046 type:complete len:241 (-) Transcript_10596:602-1324(-)